MTAQAQTALQAADVLCGYTVYIDLVRPLYPDKEVYATGMTRELDRCRWALETAKRGKTVALVCSGDAGVYGMAARCWSWRSTARRWRSRSCPA